MLEGFRKFLVEKKLVHKNAVSWYCRWISSCFESYNLDFREVLSEKQNQEFLIQFGKNHEDWQVKQAQDALRLFKYFQATKDFIPKDQKQDNVNWLTIEKNSK
jgi:predicted dithiol-disulfide oxidoreductase (DUF899 family)